MPTTQEELFDLWKLLNPTLDKRTEINASIKQGIKDIEAGRHRPAREVTEELWKKYQIRASLRGD